MWIVSQTGERKCYFGAIYHPPNAKYKKEEILNSIQTTLEHIFGGELNPFVVLGGDFNQLNDSEITSLGLTNEKTGPTHAGHHLDKIFTSEPIYLSSFSITSSVKTRHKAVIATMRQTVKQEKQFKASMLRRRTPTQHAALLRSLKDYSWIDVLRESDADVAFNKFYEINYLFLNKFYPFKSVVLSDRDPDFITPEIKLMLRDKNKLMMKGKIAAA